ncbi:MFS transporter [Hymenobacter arizonensis]|uniref:Predicted arabinose efflux permease, MFS family n=1 Tax=Hymenobacter arizonensis TaxID=1227077 RepID=A0A1I5ZSG8_HYMAR|nr:MFS transporter [Hymenobacter arizonensis]SFQ59371.1 Predicted arabinose efflux permease, MFS family [Hymenobacter arizonensis]
MSSSTNLRPRWVLPTIVFAQFACTSLWFAGNAVLPDLLRDAGLVGTSLGAVVSAVQLGFIVGTLAFGLLRLADRVPPARLFLLCAVAGSLTNAALLLPGPTPALVLGLRFATGLCLAGIYPVGMKIAADYYENGLGRALGYLVGALVLGTALPHLLRLLAADFAWQAVVLATSGLALSGGLLLWLLVPNGPFRRPGARLQLAAAWDVFRERPFRQAALGYFGHMWELYTFWAFVPLLLATHARLHPEPGPVGPGWAFGLIAAGAPACVAGGYLARRWGSLGTARAALAVSGACCLLSPLLLALPRPAFGVGVLVWGMAVVADSPQFSALVAQRAPAAATGTALTLVTCLGFALTIVSLQAFAGLQPYVEARYLFLLLVPGPVLGLLATRRAAKRATA